MKKNILSIITVSIILAAAIYGGIKAFRDQPGDVFIEGNDPNLPCLELYTSGQATTPQLALFAAIRQGDLRGLFNLKIILWKNPDELLSLVLAGKGDLWIGHTDGFALARLRNAPVRMLVFSSFNKFYIISSETENWNDLNGRTVAYTPAGSPAVGLINIISERTSAKLNLVPYQGRELELLLLSGKVKTAIIPEPLVSLILSKSSNMKIIANVEDLFCRTTGTPGKIPVAGIAVNRFTAQKYPEKIAMLQQIIIRRSEMLNKKGIDAAGYFPPYFDKYISAHIVRLSLERETISARRPEDLEQELFLYLGIIHPDLFNKKSAHVMKDFIWRQ
ncbi:MAG: ABC transporter substrate-binding protein [Spirochaetes bacterium]|nr:ABC transporter substrate-binding protein [Spirochaetota bacterium]